MARGRAKTKIKEVRLSVWEIDSSIALEGVIDNLRLDYNLPISYLADRADLQERDKTLENGWHPANGETDFSINSLNIANTDIRYVHASGYYEKAESEQKAVINVNGTNNTVVPRHLRVFNRSCPTVFFEIESKVYALVEVSNSEESRVRSVLFGQGRGDNKKEEWKKINYKEILQFSWDSQFFYWLLSKIGSSFSHESDPEYTISLLDVSAVAQLTTEQEYDSTSKGANVLGSLPALSGLGTNQSVYEAGFAFQFPNMTLTLRMSDNSTCFINSSASNIIGENGESLNIEQDYVRVVLTIYGILLLTLKRKYNSDVANRLWTVSQEQFQRKNWALYVIRELCEENDISLDDVKGILPESNN